MAWTPVRLLASEALAVGLSSPHVAGLSYNARTGALHLLYDRAQPPVLRTWHLARGQLLGDWPLPGSVGDAADGAAVTPRGSAWSGLAMSSDGGAVYVTRSSPPQLWRFELGAQGVPTCVL